MPKQNSFCCVDNLSVLIPYRDLEKLIQIANNYDQVLDRIGQIDRRLDGLQGIQSEIIEKVGELQEII